MNEVVFLLTSPRRSPRYFPHSYHLFKLLIANKRRP